MTFDLDHWLTDLNINRDHLLIMDYMSYHVLSFWGKKFLNYHLHKVWESKMTFDLNFWPPYMYLNTCINRDHLLKLKKCQKFYFGLGTNHNNMWTMCSHSVYICIKHPPFIYLNNCIQIHLNLLHKYSTTYKHANYTIQWLNTHWSAQKSMEFALK